MMSGKKKVYINTLGCKVNQYESACISDDFLKNGYELAAAKEIADVYVINTCTVTNRTDFKSRNAIRRALAVKKERPSTIVIVTGCYAELNAKQIAEIGDIDLVAGNEFKGSLIELLKQAEKIKESQNRDSYYEITTEAMPERVRAFLKIQDGCDCLCSYCIVPFARGKSRSRVPEKIIEQVKKLVASGYKEFVIAGVNLGLYGRERSASHSLSQVLQMIEDVEGVERIRISSIEPHLIDDELLAYFGSSKKLCPHLHIPMQSGCDTILEKMNRRTSTSHFFTLLQKIKSILPNAAIGIDIILGLPGETDELFNETADFVKSLPITYAHVFPYSKRRGTLAAKMGGQVKHSIAKERCRIIKEIVDAKKEEYIDELINNKVILSGIIESERREYKTALSDHYIRIYLKNKEIKENDIAFVTAESRLLDGVLAKELP